MKKQSKLFLMVAISSIASQIYVNMFVDGFIIALSVVMMGFFLYVFKDIEPTLACGLIGIFSPLFRLFIVLFRGAPIFPSLTLVLPDMAFFFAYALIFGVIFNFLGYNSYKKYYIRLVVSDFLSNCAEMATRFIVLDTKFGWNQISGLIILALCRSFFIILLCVFSDVYTSLLTKKEHEDNYKKLAIMASTFKSEVYFMEKNMNEIEEIMKNAFTLYRTLAQEKYPKELQNISLEIAKDIHEVKKGYKRVIMGLEDNFLTDLNYAPLKLNEIMVILATHVNNNAANRKLDLTFSYSVQTNYIINNHFAMMSILRNLVSNSMDALEGNNMYKGHIKVSCSDIIKDNEKFCRILVSDNGPGIDKNLIDVIFEPGFSTKYNKQTGDINRGVGLTLVHDLTVEKFKGQIEVTSTKRGTTFKIDIPVQVFDIPIKEDEIQ